MQISDDELISYLSKLEISALFLLSGANAAPIPNETAYQKELFFIANNDEELCDDADFEPYYYGPYSEPAKIALEHLISYGLGEKKGNSYYITAYGKKIVQLLKNKNLNADLEIFDEIKDFLNDLTHHERILVTYVINPDYTTESQIRNKILSERVQLAHNMYQKGKVGLEMAAHLAGISMENLLDKIRKNRHLA
ncbi:MAG: hypothetical protein LBV40_06970 [Methanomicrobiales archaeon]|jgi:uncharacterized protein YwgA|nr:hypothetical protein [Methanomicrobiales archaeon]